jgi:hypothetical protein
MRLTLSRCPAASVDGSALLVTLLFGFLTSLTLASFLLLVNQNSRVTERSQAYNLCMAVVEAGVEEALAHCKTNSPNALATCGWALAGGSLVKTNAMLQVESSEGPGGGTVWRKSATNGYYIVTLSATRPYIITCTGFYPFYRSEGAGYLSRTVQVETVDDGVFSAGIIVKEDIDMNGNTLLTDSYQSSNPAKSTLGAYDPAKAGDKGDVATLAGAGQSVNIGAANIWGHFYSGPAVALQVGASGAVGSVGWQTAGNHGVEPTWWITDFNVSLPDAVAPFTTAWTPSAGSVDGVSYDYVLGSGEYALSTFGKNVIVTGHAVLYVSLDIRFTGSDSITIAPGASLTLYHAGADAEFNSVVNANTDASTFQYYGLPTNTSVALNGLSTLKGAIYAPNARIQISGTGDAYGSLVGRQLRLNGTTALHYDEDLIQKGMSRGFIVTRWREL